MNERLNQIKESERRINGLQHAIQARTSAGHRLAERAVNQTSNLAKLRIARIILANNAKIEQNQARIEEIAAQALSGINFEELAASPQAETSIAATKSTKMRKPEVSNASKESSTHEITPSQEPAKKVAGKTGVERHTTEEEWIAPTGKKLKVTSARFKLLSLIEQKPTSMEDLKQITGKEPGYIAATISQLNKRTFKRSGLQIHNLNNAKNVGGLYVLQYHGAESRIIAKSKGERYEELQITEEKTSEEIVEESEEKIGLTNYEAAIIAHLLSADETIEEFREKGIPILANDMAEFIMGNTPVIQGGNNLSTEQMKSIRENIVKKVKEICESGAHVEIFDSAASENDPKNQAVAELMLYLDDFGTQSQEAFEIILKNLNNIKNLHWTTDKGNIFDIGNVKGEEKYQPPTPTPDDRWNKTRVALQEPRIVKPTQQNARPIVEMLGTETEKGTIEAIPVVSDTSAEDVRKADFEPNQPLTPPVLGKETAEPEKYKDLLARDPLAVKHMREIVGRNFTLFPSEPSVNQFTHHYDKITNTFIRKEREKRHVAQIKDRSNPKITHVDAALLAYIAQYDPENNFSSRAIKDIQKLAKEIVEIAQARMKRNENGQNGK